MAPSEITTHRGLRLLRWPRIEYSAALAAQLQLVAEIAAGESPECVILATHPPVFTIGRSGTPAEVLATRVGETTIPVIPTDRGGRVTYHGPGQLIIYLLRDLRPNIRRVAAHVHLLEEMAIRALARLGVTATRDPTAPGVWVAGAKIAALGVRVKQGITYHGLALNHTVELAPFAAIIPCGLAGRAVTSLESLGITISAPTLEELLLQTITELLELPVIQP